MTVENEVANLTTSVDSLTEAVNVKKQTLDASVADSEAARDQSQTARDTAENHKLAAESAATSATNTAASLAGFDLEAIAASKSLTDVVDVFVYDTSKDSDGGAWRKRTQHTSWYNETLNTTTRGGRREFPSVAVIVAESDKVTIYDGDDPALPMWMVFNTDLAGWHLCGFDTTADCTSVFFLNGILVAGGTHPNTPESRALLSVVDFIKDSKTGYRNASFVGLHDFGPIANRNSSSLMANSGTIINDDSVLIDPVSNDVAMTVLPDAPIDPATGLPEG